MRERLSLKRICSLLIITFLGTSYYSALSRMFLLVHVTLRSLYQSTQNYYLGNKIEKSFAYTWFRASIPVILSYFEPSSNKGSYPLSNSFGAPWYHIISIGSSDQEAQHAHLCIY